MRIMNFFEKAKKRMCESCKSMINRGIKGNAVMFFTKNSVFVQKKEKSIFPR